MLLELHILQNFAPSNLNRDDTGSPKTCEFGGYRRARISSQAIKRAIRREFKAGLLPLDNVAERSKRFREVVAEHLVNLGHEAETSMRVFDAALGAIGILSETKGEDSAARTLTEVLLFADHGQLMRFAAVCDEHWDILTDAYDKVWSKAKGKPGKDAAKKAVPARIADALKLALDGTQAADLALFGRMLADLPERNIDAASQVAHAISTHQVSSEFDYYTAVDDRQPDDTEGADMIGTVEFNSACYYRYANVDLAQLKKNLGGDEALAEATVRAFLVASRDAIPTGKQNSFAARNAPSFIMTVVRPAGAWSLANAFVNPVRPSGHGIIANSIAALDQHWGDLTGVYGAPTGASVAFVATGEAELANLGAARVATFNELLERTVTAAGGS
jgi:CRISPR system Cascade subunit CasC